jgi:hypothetical protein
MPARPCHGCVAAAVPCNRICEWLAREALRQAHVASSCTRSIGALALQPRGVAPGAYPDIHTGPHARDRKRLVVLPRAPVPSGKRLIGWAVALRCPLALEPVSHHHGWTAAQRHKWFPPLCKRLHVAPGSGHRRCSRAPVPFGMRLIGWAMLSVALEARVAS